VKKITLTSSQAFKAWKIYRASLKYTVSWSTIRLHMIVSPTKLRSGNHAKHAPKFCTKHGCQPVCLLESKCLGLTAHVKSKQTTNKQIENNCALWLL
jgi:hypothetical protein